MEDSLIDSPRKSSLSVNMSQWYVKWDGEIYFTDDGIGRCSTLRILSSFSDSIDLATEIPPKYALVTNATGPIAMNFPSLEVTIGSSSARAPSIIDVPIEWKANTIEKQKVLKILINKSNINWIWWNTLRMSNVIDVLSSCVIADVLERSR